tara:strand:+ start:9877 stop:10803 length:927 start_codon:yes stop_codon:yes gene_type:complete
MAINSGSFAKALWPGVDTWYGQAYDEHKVEYTDLFDTVTSKKAFEEDVGVSAFGLAPVKTEGGSITYDTERQAFVTRYVHVAYGLGFIVTREIFDDDLYGVVGQRRAKGLAFSMRQTKETVAANVYNRAFDTSYLGGDGSTLIASAGGGSSNHPNFAGGTWTNGPSTASDLSEASLEQACIDIMKFTDDRGLKIAVMPKCLIIPVDLVFDAERILKSTLRVATADNDSNALKDMGKFPDGVKVNHYLSDTNAWFIRTNAQNGMKCYNRRAMDFSIDNDFDTENAKFKATERYSLGWTDARCMYGSAGA